MMIMSHCESYTILANIKAMMRQKLDRESDEEGSRDSIDINMDNYPIRPRRGRPKLSLLSMVVTSRDINFGEEAFIYVRLEDYQDLVASIEEEFIKKDSKANEAPLIYCLKKGKAEAENLAKYEKLTWDCVEHAVMNIKAKRDAEKKEVMRRVCFEVRDTLNHEVQKATPNPIRVTDNDEQKKLWKILNLRFIQNLNIKDVVFRTRVSIATVFRVCKKFTHDPQLFNLNQIGKCKEKTIFGSDLAEQLKQSLQSGEVTFPNRASLIDYLSTRNPNIDSNNVTRVIKAAKAELKIVKRKVKRAKIVKPYDNLENLTNTAKLALLQFFHIEGSMLVFDCTSFTSNDFAEYSWTIRGIRPQISVKSAYRFRHTYALISAQGFEAVALCRGSSTKDTIRCFFIQALSRLIAQHNGLLPYRYVFLDNAPIHCHKQLSEIAGHYDVKFVFNMPNSPDYNPIEDIFGVVKSKFRQIVGINGVWTDANILQSISWTHKYRFTKTIRRNYHYLVKCLS